MLAQHRLRAFAHHRSVPLFLNRPAAALVTAAAAVLTRPTSTALGKGGNIRRSEPIRFLTLQRLLPHPQQNLWADADVGAIAIQALED